MAGLAADALDPADEGNVGPDHGDIQARIGSDVATADLAMMESNACAHSVRRLRDFGQASLVAEQQWSPQAIDTPR